MTVKEKRKEVLVSLGNCAETGKKFETHVKEERRSETEDVRTKLKETKVFFTGLSSFSSKTYRKPHRKRRKIYIKLGALPFGGEEWT